MTDRRLRPALHATLAWTLAVAFITTLWSLVLAPPLARQRELRERLPELSYQKERLAAQIARLDTASAAAAPLLDPALLLSPAPATHAAAELQARVSALLAQHDARVNSMQVLPAYPDTPLAVIGLRLQFQIRMADLQTLLHALATQRPLLLQDNLTTQAQHVLSGEHFALATDLLDVSLDVLAFGAAVAE